MLTPAHLSTSPPDPCSPAAVDRAMLMYKYQEWNRLTGAKVQVRKNGTIMRVGTVEQAMPDNSALWLAAQGVDGRIYLEKSDGHEIWLEPQIFYALL